MRRPHISLRVDEDTIRIVEALEEQLKEKSSDILRNALSVGLRVLAAQKPPDTSGYYGGFTPERLASELRFSTLILSDFQLRHGKPLLQSEGSGVLVPAPGSPLPREVNIEPVKVTDDMEETLGGFTEI